MSLMGPVSNFIVWVQHLCERKISLGIWDPPLSGSLALGKAQRRNQGFLIERS